MKILILYYSRTGNTKNIAELLKERLDADCERIEDKKNRKGIIGYLKSGADALMSHTTNLKPVNSKPEDYDLVLIGSPVWASNLPPPIRTLLIDKGKDFDKTAYFCTCGSSIGKTADQIESLLDAELAEVLQIVDDEISSKKLNEKVDNFIEKLLES